jgi:hypothetical protein
LKRDRQGQLAACGRQVTPALLGSHAATSTSGYDQGAFDIVNELGRRPRPM